jgi:hypothetical protein
MGKNFIIRHSLFDIRYLPAVIVAGSFLPSFKEFGFRQPRTNHPRTVFGASEIIEHQISFLKTIMEGFNGLHADQKK